MRIECPLDWEDERHDAANHEEDEVKHRAITKRERRVRKFRYEPPHLCSMLNQFSNDCASNHN